MTNEDIRKLREGDRVLVVWRGGNGPCEYEVVRRGPEGGHVWTAVEGHLIHPIGDGVLSTLDRVWLLSEGSAG